MKKSENNYLFALRFKVENHWHGEKDDAIHQRHKATEDIDELYSKPICQRAGDQQANGCRRLETTTDQGKDTSLDRIGNSSPNTITVSQPIVARLSINITRFFADFNQLHNRWLG